jgi:uncharacterized protein DUF6152
MKTLRALFLVLAAAAIVSPPVAAHHGRGRAYDMKTRLTLKGTVSMVKWQNPHVLIYIDVTDDASKVVTWAFENSNVHTLAVQGYNRNTLKVGDQITAIVNPAANGEPLGIVVKVILASGKEIMSRERGNPVD